MDLQRENTFFRQIQWKGQWKEKKKLATMSCAKERMYKGLEQCLSTRLRRELLVAVGLEVQILWHHKSTSKGSCQPRHQHNSIPTTLAAAEPLSLLLQL